MKAVDMIFDIDQLTFHFGVNVSKIQSWIDSGELRSLKGADIIVFGFYHTEYQRYCEALIRYYDGLLSSNVGPKRSKS